MKQNVYSILRYVKSYLLLTIQYIVFLLKRYPKSVIPYRTTGLGDCLITSAHAWHYAKITNRTLIINWIPSRYLDDKTANAFSYFFIAPNDIEGVPVIVESKSRLKPFHILFREIQPLSSERQQWMNNLAATGKPAKNRYLCFNECFTTLMDNSGYKIKPFFDSLKLQPTFQTKVNRFSQEHFSNKKVIADHIRYYSPNLVFSKHTPHWHDQEQSLNKIKTIRYD